jgi:hypothetical protein
MEHAQEKIQYQQKGGFSLQNRRLACSNTGNRRLGDLKVRFMI